VSDRQVDVVKVVDKTEQKERGGRGRCRKGKESGRYQGEGEEEEGRKEGYCETKVAAGRPGGGRSWNGIGRGWKVGGMGEVRGRISEWAGMDNREVWGGRGG